MKIMEMQTGKQLLISEPPLQVLPSLAVLIGLNEAIFLQQLHYWLLKSEHTHENRKWVYNTYEQWQQQFPFWSISTIKRIVATLSEIGILIIGNYNYMKIDRTNWYSINYETLDTLTTTHRVKLNHPSCQVEPSRVASCTDQYHKNTTENTTENTTTSIYTQNLQSFASSHENFPFKREKKAQDKLQVDKKLYLDFVLLTEDQYNELVAKFGQEGTDDYIERLNNYIHQIGRKKAESKYKSHYHVILNWSNRDRKEIERRVHVAETMRKRDGILRPGESIFDD